MKIRGLRHVRSRVAGIIVIDSNPVHSPPIMKSLAALLSALAFTLALQAQQWVTYTPPEGKANGKSVVLISGDEEYRSEEGLPQLAKILSQRHGFKCTVVFSINPKTGEIDPNTQTNEPGIEALDSADLCIMLLRFRAWPDDQMKHFADYYLAGKPFIALRTSTHAFSYPDASTSVYKAYSWNGKTWPQGFGKQVLGETWVSHWGNHKHEATLGVVEPGSEKDKLLRGVTGLFGDTDVYEAHPPADAKILFRGRVLKGMSRTDEPADYKKKTATGVEQGVNEPMQPVVWTREYKNEAGHTNKVFTTTMGSATDLQDENLRRLLVNTAFRFTGQKVPKAADVALVGEFHPTAYGFNGFVKGVKPADHVLK